MDISKLLSVIIPVYNTADYLEQCVNSVLQQKYSPMEIIIINDCSTDDSRFLIDKLAELDSRIKVVHKTINEGVGCARNTGIALAKGSFFTFIDSDDWLEPDVYSKMMNKMIQANLDIIQGKMVLDFGMYVLCSKDTEVLKIFLTEEAQLSLMLLREITASVCDKIFKAEIFTNINFNNTRIYEDTEILFLLINESKKVGFYDKSTYRYRQNINSLSHQPISIEKALLSMEICKKRIMFFEKKSEILYFSAKKKYFTKIIGIYYTLDKKQYGSGKFLIELCLTANNLLQEILPKMPMKERILLKLLAKSLRNNFAGFFLKPIVAFLYGRKKWGLGLDLRKSAINVNLKKNMQ